MQPRRLRRFPNYDRAQPLDVVGPEIGEAGFFERYVSVHRACVVRGAARHWPAVAQWNLEMLRGALRDVPVGRNFGLRYEPMALYSLDTFREMLSPLNGVATYGDFLDMVAARDRPYLQLNSEPLGRLEADIGEFSFIDLERRPARYYGDRLFVSRAGYTDWHVHTMDETLTAQICGPKEVLMLSPEPATFDAMYPICRRGVWQVPESYWTKEFASLVPWHAVLEPGDAVYIPMHWWHALEGLDEELNVTMAKTFGTPLAWLGDLRLPNARLAVRLNLAMAAVFSANMRSVDPLWRGAQAAAIALAAFPLSLGRSRVGQGRARDKAWRHTDDHGS